MTRKQAWERCDAIWELLPRNNDDALEILAMITARFADEVPHARDMLVTWLDVHTRTGEMATKTIAH